MNEIDVKLWLQVINNKMNQIGVEESAMRKYGAVNQAELLAVVSEFFFESPKKMKTEHLSLFMALDRFFLKKIRKI